MLCEEIRQSLSAYIDDALTLLACGLPPLLRGSRHALGSSDDREGIPRWPAAAGNGQGSVERRHHGPRRAEAEAQQLSAQEVARQAKARYILRELAQALHPRGFEEVAGDA